MKVKKLISLLERIPSNYEVVIHTHKNICDQVRLVEIGQYVDYAGEFQSNVDNEEDFNAVLISD